MTVMHEIIRHPDDEVYCIDSKTLVRSGDATKGLDGEYRSDVEATEESNCETIADWCEDIASAFESAQDAWIAEYLESDDYGSGYAYIADEVMKDDCDRVSDAIDNLAGTTREYANDSVWGDAGYRWVEIPNHPVVALTDRTRNVNRWCRDHDCIEKRARDKLSEALEYDYNSNVYAGSPYDVDIWALTCEEHEDQVEASLFWKWLDDENKPGEHNLDHAGDIDVDIIMDNLDVLCEKLDRGCCKVEPRDLIATENCKYPNFYYHGGGGVWHYGFSNEALAAAVTESKVEHCQDVDHNRKDK